MKIEDKSVKSEEELIELLEERDIIVDGDGYLFDRKTGEIKDAHIYEKETDSYKKISEITNSERAEENANINKLIAVKYINGEWICVHGTLF